MYKESHGSSGVSFKTSQEITHDIINIYCTAQTAVSIDA